MTEIKNAIENYINALNDLKRLNVIKNQKDFTSQVGEWISSIIYNGKIAESGKQPYWDLEVGEEKYQVKSHAKADTTNRKNTDFKYPINSEIDFIIIIVFDESYKIEKIYKVPFEIAYNLVDRTKTELVVKWKDLDNEYLENLEEIFKNNEILNVFK